MEMLTTYVIKYDDHRRILDFKEIPYSSLELARYFLDGYETFPEEIIEGLRTMIRKSGIKREP